MFKTIFRFFLLLIILIFFRCASKGPEVAASSVEKAQKIIEAKRAEQNKNAKKLKKEAIKRNLKIQSKPVRKSLKRNAKKLKRRSKLIDKRELIGPNYNKPY